MDIGKPVKRHKSVPAPSGPDHVPEKWPDPVEPAREPVPAPREPAKTPA